MTFLPCSETSKAASSETKLKQLESNVGFVSSVFGVFGGSHGENAV